MTSKQAEISIADIQNELARQWEAQKEKNLIRASLFNLVIYALDKARSDYLREIVKTIIEKYPCRIIFVQGNPEPGKDFIKATVTNEIIGKGDSAVACDQINIEVSSKQLHRVPFIILPNFLPDLPIYLLWGQDPTTEYEILPSLRRYASRLIFDSDCTLNLQSFSRKMLLEIETSKLEIRDMNWAATGAWREVIAQVFDSEEKIRLLRNSKRIQITYNSLKTDKVSHPEIQAIYLQGWIAAQMGWQFRSIEIKEDQRKVVYVNGDNHVEVDLIPRLAPELIPGAIISVDVASIEEHSFLIVRKDNQPKVFIHVTTQDRCEMPFALTLPDMRKGSFFMQELFYRRTSDHYHNMLSLIAQYNCQKT